MYSPAQPGLYLKVHVVFVPSQRGIFLMKNVWRNDSLAPEQKNAHILGKPLFSHLELSILIITHRNQSCKTCGQQLCLRANVIKAAD